MIIAVNSLDSTDKNGQTALMFAARGGHHLCVKMLIEKGEEREKGPNVNQQDNCGETALMHAARCNTDTLSSPRQKG